MDRYIAFLALAIVLILAACSPDQPRDVLPPAGESQARDLDINPTSDIDPDDDRHQDPKTIPPIKLDLIVGDDTYAGGEFPFAFIFIPSREVYTVRASLQASGNLSLIGEQDFEWQNLLADNEISTQASFQISEHIQEGELLVNVMVLDEDGNLLFGRSARMYFFASDQGVFTSTVSPSKLRIEYIKRAFQSGDITEEEYQSALEEIKGGGAIEQIVVMTPTP